MKKFTVILTVIAALSSCGQSYMQDVRNNSSCTVRAVISDGTTLSLAPGRSDEIDRWEKVRSFTAEPARASMRILTDGYEFYHTPPIALSITNLSPTHAAKLYSSGCIDDYTDPSSPAPAEPVQVGADTTTDVYKIYTTTPTLRAVAVANGSEPPLLVTYEYDRAAVKIYVTIR